MKKSTVEETTTTEIMSITKTVRVEKTIMTNTGSKSFVEKFKKGFHKRWKWLLKITPLIQLLKIISGQGHSP